MQRGEQIQQRYLGSSSGFTLMELIIALGLGVVVLTAALVMTSQAIDLNDIVTQRSDMQQNARVAVNMMSREFTVAGTGYSTGGIQLPAGSLSVDSLFACDTSNCYILNNIFTAERLYAVNPADGEGPTVKGASTDVVTLVYKDATSSLDALPLVDIDPTGSPIFFDTAMTPAYNDPSVGVRVGDLLVLSNVNGTAAGVVTEVRSDGEVLLSENDPLKFNQPNAAFGNVPAILSPPAPDAFPQTVAYRVNMVSYYIDNSDPDSPTLMRHSGGHKPVPLAENIENLQITYDIYDENTSVVTTNLPDAGGSPNLIRKINLTLTARSPHVAMLDGQYQRLSLNTSVGPRNLTFRDRYE